MLTADMALQAHVVLLCIAQSRVMCILEVTPLIHRLDKLCMLEQPAICNACKLGYAIDCSMYCAKARVTSYIGIQLIVCMDDVLWSSNNTCKVRCASHYLMHLRRGFCTLMLRIQLVFWMFLPHQMV